MSAPENNDNIQDVLLELTDNQNDFNDLQADDALEINSTDSLNEEDELKALRKRIEVLEEETNRVHNLTESFEEGFVGLTDDEKAEIDSRSVYVGNVDYTVTPGLLQEHFKSCGTINRVTIICDKHSHAPKGYGYIEFADPSLVANALVLHGSILNGRPLKVLHKRTNFPGMAARGGPYRGGRRGTRSRGGPPRGPRGSRGRPYYFPTRR